MIYLQFEKISSKGLVHVSNNSEMVRKDFLVIGGFFAAVGVVLIPIYVMPKLNPQSYESTQEINRRGMNREEIQPGGMKIWSDPFDRKKTDDDK